ncbi:glycosyltransferase family 2 protein [Planctomycetota bacterium]|nr:glycosyltransferase family 2 protein [Planctomycetota bacterium]
MAPCNTTKTTSGKCPSPRVAVLLCTYNGEKFLKDQLMSIDKQTHDNISIWVSDDGSNDGTIEIIRDFQKLCGKDITVLRGPRKGYAANFLSLLCNSDITADYFSFADQDDIWNEQKLSLALKKISGANLDTPSLYCSRTAIIDEDGTQRGLSPLFSNKPCFQNALVQSIGGGNTMLLNNAARALIASIGENVTIVSHDWWAYLVVTGAGGQVFYDPSPLVGYRQHSSNVFASNIGFRARLKRAASMLNGTFHDWVSTNLSALATRKDFLSNDNRCVFRDFSIARNKWLIPRLYYMKKSGIYRQTKIDNIALLAAAFLNKI